MCNKSLDTLLAPNTLCTAANRAAPWSVPKWGAKIHPLTHFLLRNLHAPQGAAGAGNCDGDSDVDETVPGNVTDEARLPEPRRRDSD